MHFHLNFNNKNNVFLCFWHDVHTGRPALSKILRQRSQSVDGDA